MTSTEHLSDTDRPPRRVHIVGTVPASDNRQAMQLMTAQLGRHLRTMPDGETTRPQWIVEFVEARAKRPELRTLRVSRLTQPRPLRPVLDAPRYTARKGITFDTLCLPYLAEARSMWPVYQEIAPDGVRPQFGIPSPIDVAASSWANPFRYYELEALGAANEVDAIFELTGGTAVFQLEIPLETVAVCKTPSRLRERVADRLAHQLVEFVKLTTRGTTWIIHLCRGNKHDTELMVPPDVAGETELANAIWTAWPAAYPLDGFHFPFGGPSMPAPYDPDYYYPLTTLVIPDTVALLAGVVRTPGADLRQHRWALRAADTAARRRCGVSTPCGLGRQLNTVHTTFEMLSKLVYA